MGAVLLVRDCAVQSLRVAQGALARSSMKGEVMKKLLSVGAALAALAVAGPAFADTACTDASSCIAEVGTSMTTNTGYALAAMAASAGAAIGLAYLSGMIKTAMGWGKAKK